jgi:16S rRNA (uracil1498-N3)-methyltransferase
MFFYLENPFKLIMDSQSSGHFISMRASIGDILETTDLKGALTKIQISRINRKNRTIEYQIIDQQKFIEPPKKTLFQAITDKLYLEKLVEVAPLAGITKIYFYESKNSISDRIKLQRLDKIIIRSCEQSQQLFKTELEFIDEKSFLEKIKQYKPGVLDLPIKTVNDKKSLIQNDSVIVGPEGGFTSQERSLFEISGLNFLSLGNTILPSWLAGFVYFTRN